MKFETTREKMVGAVLIGAFGLLRPAGATIAVGRPPTDYNQPTMAAVRKFLRANPDGVSLKDMNGFSCAFVHDCAVTDSNSEMAAMPNVIPEVRTPALAAMNKHSNSGSSSVFSAFPCPRDFKQLGRYGGGIAYCEQFQTDQDTGYMVQTDVWVDADGIGVQSVDPLGIDPSLSYGNMLQRIYKLDGNQVPVYVTDFDNLFFTRESDALAVASQRCHSGHMVTYVGPSGKVVNGKPEGGYQVQYNAQIDDSDLGQAFLPPGDSNYCLTLPPIPL